MAAFQLIEEDLICARPVPKSVSFLCNHLKQIFEAGYEEQRATGEKKVAKWPCEERCTFEHILFIIF